LKATSCITIIKRQYQAVVVELSFYLLFYDPCLDSNKVDDIVRKFKSKYGEENVKKYYLKVDVAVDVSL
jgi:hypothetical protein